MTGELNKLWMKNKQTKKKPDRTFILLLLLFSRFCFSISNSLTHHCIANTWSFAQFYRFLFFLRLQLYREVLFSFHCANENERQPEKQLQAVFSQFTQPEFDMKAEAISIHRLVGLQKIIGNYFDMFSCHFTDCFKEKKPQFPASQCEYLLVFLVSYDIKKERFLLLDSLLDKTRHLSTLTWTLGNCGHFSLYSDMLLTK